jgi:ABC-2 type transport system ATP-binding protein
MQDILTIKNFTKRYGKKLAVDNLSLTVSSGHICGFIGHNGAGKTTTLRAVAGVMDFDGGDIFIDGHNVKAEPVACKKITAFLPDKPDLYDYLTGVQFLSFIADIYEVPKAEREAAVQKYSGLLGLTADLSGLISSYSHGMRQKLSLISAFMHSPRLLLLDEPFVGLDPQASFHLKGMMNELTGRGGAIFFSTHILDVAEKLCNKVAIIKGGRLVAGGDTEAVTGDSSLEELFLEVARHD